ncbi:MAG: hypothetical protein K2X77_29375 [Candidatus Obscuribacterales bacterium]|nr:hypothetical protein [Candidatus Obscuribacterales bacterium]
MDDRSLDTDKIQQERTDSTSSFESFAAPQTDKLWHAIQAPKSDLALPSSNAAEPGQKAEALHTSMPTASEQLPRVLLIGAEKNNILDAPVSLENIGKTLKLGIGSIPDSFAGASSGLALIMHGKNESFQHRLGIPSGQAHLQTLNKYVTLNWTDGMLKTAKILSVPTMAIGATNFATDANRFLSNDYSKAFYGTALAFDSLTVAGAVAQVFSNRPVMAISSFGLLGRALMGGVEHFSKK